MKEHERLLQPASDRHVLALQLLEGIMQQLVRHLVVALLLLLLGCAYWRVLLLLLPTELNAGMSPGRVLPLEEKLTLQSWAAFMLGVGYIAHAAPSLPLSAQTAIARGLALCFMIETVLYGYYAAFGLASSSPEYRVGVICTGSIFVVLWAAYSAALLGASVPAAPKKS